jgi:hypothetical protein
VSERILPAKISGYLRRLQLSYQNNGPSLGASERSDMAQLTRIIASARCYVREDTAFYTDDTTGHDILLFAPLAVLGSVNLDSDERLREKLTKDLRRCAASVGSEYVRSVAFEPEDENDLEYQRSRPVAVANQIAPESVAFWTPGEIRLFLSHRDSHKRDARRLGDELKAFGISAFVAHDTIQPMSEWRNEILKALETMEVMLAFITDDFSDSNWTQQEIGFAIGRGVPVISLQLESRAPTGFLETTQAIKATADQHEQAAYSIYEVLAEKLGSSKRLQNGLLTAFCSSSSYVEARDRFDRLSEAVTKLSVSELETILKAFAANDQLRGSGYLTHPSVNRLLKFLERTTGKAFTFAEGRIQEKDDLDDEIPF